MLFKSAIIGCGKIAGGYDIKVPDKWSFTHAGAYHLCKETRLTAIADISEKALNQFSQKWEIDNCYTDYKDLLDKESIDILSICLLTEKHYEVFKYACEKGVPAIFCEKPLSYDLKEARDMVEMSNDRVVAVNYFRRWNPALFQLREELCGGKFGRVLNATIHYTKGLFVNGSHLVDLMRWFFGEPNDVRLIRTTWQDARDFGIDFAMTFSNNITSFFLSVQDANYVFINIDILTEKGRIVIGQRGQDIERHEEIVEPHFQRFDILKRVETKETQWRDCLTLAVQEMVDCLKNGGQVSCTSEDGLRALEICCEVVSQSE